MHKQREGKMEESGPDRGQRRKRIIFVVVAIEQEKGTL